MARAGENRFAHSRPPLSRHEWTTCVGSRIAHMTLPLSLRRGVLTVQVATSGWAAELSLLSDAILQKLPTQLGVQALRFCVGEVAPQASLPVFSVPSPLAEIPPELQEGLHQIDDPELRFYLSEAVKARLAWKKS